GRLAELPREALRDRLEIVALARDDHKVGVELARVGRRAQAHREVGAPGYPEPVLVERACVLGAAHEHRDLRDTREVRGEEAADRAGPGDADARHRRHRSANSRPPVSPDGRRMSTSAMTAPIVTSRVPFGSVSRKPTCTVFSASPRNELSALIARAPSTAPHRLATPPNTSMARVTNVRSR